MAADNSVNAQMEALETRIENWLMKVLESRIENRLQETVESQILMMKSIDGLIDLIHIIELSVHD